MEVKKYITSKPPPNPQQLIEKERNQNPKFPIDAIHQFLEGNDPAKAQLILELYRQLEIDPILSSNFNEYDMSQDENRALTGARIARLTRYLEIESLETFFRRLSLITVYDPSLGIRISINLGLFLNCVKGNGTDSQVEYWANFKESCKIKQLYGCFGMTELGHGSNVAGCETTATFDKAADEFVINTPNISATKWWIGGAAHSATHSVVYARLIVEGKDYGVKTFIVPLRDSNHELMPGVAIGDIGAKMGRQGVDNGWIQFASVRIPRFFMLQKWCKVDANGKVTLPPLEQLSYISLLGGRVNMAVDSYRICARFITVALRYAVGRRQFKSNFSSDPKQETQLLDYPLHQRRLFPFLAATYVMAVGTNKLELQHKQCVDQLDEAVAKNDMDQINRGLQTTKSLFNDSGSLKATLTWIATDCIDQCRQACGGHGYSAYNGFGKAFNDWVVQCTWEGDNNVLSMSCGKTIINHLQNIMKGKRLSNSTMDFLNNAPQYKDITNVLQTESDLSAENVLKTLEALMIKIGISAVEALQQPGQDYDTLSVTRVLLSKLRCHHYLMQAFNDQLKQAPETATHLQSVFKVYYYTSILEPFAPQLIEHELMAKPLKSVVTMKLLPQEFTSLRPVAISLTDCFKQPDNILHSVIGNYNGNIYENYFEVVQQQNNPYNSKAPYSSDFEGFLGRTSLNDRQRGERTEEVAKILSR